MTDGVASEAHCRQEERQTLERSFAEQAQRVEGLEVVAETMRSALAEAKEEIEDYETREECMQKEVLPRNRASRPNRWCAFCKFVQ